MEQTPCKTCGARFEITDQDFAFYKRVDVPAPLSCPSCRLMRRLQERNARALYRRVCDATGEEILSIYHNDHPFPVYKQDYWWSDNWDPLKYGQKFDFNRPFFDQYQELVNRIPHFATFIIGGTLTNSDYTNCTGYIKNCYMLFEADYNEDCYYSNRLNHCTNVVDSSFLYNNEVCYECIDCQICYNLKFSQDCISCRDSFFLYDCKSCHNCIGCINQRHKRFMAFNKQYSKEEYEKIKAKYDLETLEGIETLRKDVHKFFKTQPHKNLQQEMTENSLGDHLYNSKNTTYAYDCKDLEDCKYCAKLTLGVKDSMDYNSWGMGAELIYQCSACGEKIYNLKFCSNCTADVHDCEYTQHSSACGFLFGCFGVRNRKYCILNKQYSKEEYESLRKRIIEHMKQTAEYGEFFPNSLCPFGYNETIAMDYYPLSKEEALKKGYKWTEKDRTYLKQTYKVPEKIEDVPDSITNIILACGECGKNYRIIAQELKFYRQNDLPIPNFCPDCRHLHRVKLRNPRKFHDTACTKCGKDCKTTFKEEDNFIIYCEDCYNKMVI